jgi:hypothetical protein
LTSADPRCFPGWFGQRVIKCKFLRLDPAQLPRLDQIEASTVSRIAEARERQWLGEVGALEDSLRHIRSRKTQAGARP